MNAAIQNIIKVVCDALSIERDDLLSKCRKRELADARCIMVRIAARQVKQGSKETAIMESINRDRSTFYKTSEKFEALYFTDREFKNKYNRTLQALKDFCHQTNFHYYAS